MAELIDGRMMARHRGRREERPRVPARQQMTITVHVRRRLVREMRWRQPWPGADLEQRTARTLRMTLVAGLVPRWGSVEQERSLTGLEQSHWSLWVPEQAGPGRRRTVDQTEEVKDQGRDWKGREFHGHGQRMPGLLGDEPG